MRFADVLGERHLCSPTRFPFGIPPHVAIPRDRYRLAVILCQSASGVQPWARSRVFWLVVCAVPLYVALWLFSGYVLVRDIHHSKAIGSTMTPRDNS